VPALRTSTGTAASTVRMSCAAVAHSSLSAARPSADNVGPRLPRRSRLIVRRVSSVGGNCFPPQTMTACHTCVTPRPLKRSSERRTATATLVPKREDLDPFRVRNHPVVDVVANAREVKTTNACEGNVSGAGADLGLNGDEQRGAFEFLANGVGRFRRVDAPPVLGGDESVPERGR
jgi:hypothetical protein